MSVSEDDNIDAEMDRKSDDSPRKNDESYRSDDEYSDEHNQYSDEGQNERNYQSRPMRYMNRHPSPHYRPRQMYPPNFRGHSRMPMGMPPNRGMPYMRPSRNGPPGPPFDCGPRGMMHGGRFPPRFPNQRDERDDISNGPERKDFDGMPPGPPPNFPPNMRMRGPPPFPGPNMNRPPGPPPFSGPNGSAAPPFGSPNNPPGSALHNPPPANSQNFSGPPPFPGQQFNTPPSQFNGPPGQQFNSPSGPPFSGPGPQFSGPPGPQFSGPPGSQFNGPPGSQFNGPPGPQFDGPPGSQFNGPPGTQFCGPPGPQFNGPPGSQFSGPPVSQFSGPPVSQFSGPPDQQFSGPPDQQFPGHPDQQFSGPPGQQFSGPPGQLPNGPPVDQSNGPPEDQFNGPPGPQFNGPPFGPPPTSQAQTIGQLSSSPQNQFQGPPTGPLNLGPCGFQQGPPIAPPVSGQHGAPPPSVQPILPPPGLPGSFGPPPESSPSSTPSAPEQMPNGNNFAPANQSPIQNSGPLPPPFPPSGIMNPNSEQPPATHPFSSPTMNQTPPNTSAPLLGIVPPPMESAPFQPPTQETRTSFPNHHGPMGPLSMMPQRASAPMMQYPPVPEYLAAPPPRPPFMGVPHGMSMPMMPPPAMHMMPPHFGPPFRPHMPQNFMPMPPSVPTQPIAPQPPKAPEDIWVENLTAEGKAYYYNMRTRETRWDRPDGVPIVRQGEMDRPSTSTTASTPVSTVTTITPASSSAPTPLPEKPADVAAWTEYHNMEGKPYYHNARTGETTWDKPKALIDWAAFVSGRQGIVQPPEPAPITSTIMLSPAVVEPVEPATVMTKPAVLVADTPTLPESSAPAVVTNEPAKTEVAKPKDTARPVSSTAITGTPWCVVWTGDDRAFFFNPSQRASVWERPDELKGRVDVDRLLEKRPDPESTPDPQLSQDTDSGESAAKKPRLDSDTVAPEVNTESVVAETAKVEADETSDKASVGSDKIPVGMEAAKEAEERAARERAAQPLEVRMRRFREMLIEMQVSAFSTWEKELHKIVFDPRYLLLASKERKQAFEAYVKERADEERREKKNKLKERKEKFMELLSEAGLTSRSTYSDFAAKYAKDDRFKGIDKSRDRETFFQDFLTDQRKREKEDKHKEKEKIKTEFISLLKEQKSLSRQSHWSDVKRKIDSDPRYKAVDSGSRREDLFRDFVKKLDEAPSREDSDARKDREKRERQEASLREREKEVKESLSSSLRERDKERENQLRIEQESNFRTILTELIRDPIVTWKEAKKVLRKDDRWDAVGDVIPRSEREDFFNEHIVNLSKRSRDQTSDVKEKHSTASDAADE